MEIAIDAQAEAVTNFWFVMACGFMHAGLRGHQTHNIYSQAMANHKLATVKAKHHQHNKAGTCMAAEILAAIKGPPTSKLLQPCTCFCLSLARLWPLDSFQAL